jgi:hypothetical protein
MKGLRDTSSGSNGSGAAGLSGLAAPAGLKGLRDTSSSSMVINDVLQGELHMTCYNMWVLHVIVLHVAAWLAAPAGLKGLRETSSSSSSTVSDDVLAG